MNIKNKVTVCITTYNRKYLILNVINAVLNQTYKNIEIFVIDDFSNDGTETLIKTFLKKDNRIRYFRHDKNKGLSVARNTAIFNATGKYFTFIDDDDDWDNKFIEEFVNLAMNYNKNWCFCCGNKLTDALGRNIFNIPAMNGYLYDYFKQGYTPPVSAQFYHTEILKDIGGYNENIRSGIDHDLWLSLAIRGIKIKSLEKALSICNIDPKLERITSNYGRRLKEIKQSLIIWDKNIKSNFGREFYESFCKAYILREKKKFLRNCILNLSLIKALKLYFEIRNNVELEFIYKNLIYSILIFNRIKFKNVKIIRFITPSLDITT